MNTYIGRLIFFAWIMTLLLSSANAQDTRDSARSFVAIAPDKQSCPSSEGHFIPLPELQESRYSQIALDRKINESFGKDCRINGILIKGEITSITFQQVRLGLELMEMRSPEKEGGLGPSIWLDSPGGFVSEALRIGELVAQKQLNAIVTLRGRCLSACIFIYAAARTRGGLGEIGIHRPFAEDIGATTNNYSEYLKLYDSLTPILKSYLGRFGVSPALVDLMNVVPSDNIKVLSRNELEHYGLGFKNVAAAEFEKARTIQVCGQDYYALHTSFHRLRETCISVFGKTPLDEAHYKCWDLSKKFYPNYDLDFEVCDAKKSRR